MLPLNRILSTNHIFKLSDLLIAMRSLNTRIPFSSSAHDLSKTFSPSAVAPPFAISLTCVKALKQSQPSGPNFNP